MQAGVLYGVGVQGKRVTFARSTGKVTGHMATGPHAHADSNPNPIVGPDAAKPAQTEEDKAKAAEAEAAKADEKKAAAADARFLVYTVPAQAAGKAVTRPSSEAHAHAVRADADTYANRVGVAAALARITPQQWAALIDVENAPHTEWNADNDWTVPVDKMDPKQVEYLLTTDAKYNGKRFELVDGNGRKVDS